MMSVECANIEHGRCRDPHCTCFCHGRPHQQGDGRNLLWWLHVLMVMALNFIFKRLGLGVGGKQ